MNPLDQAQEIAQAQADAAMAQVIISDNAASEARQETQIEIAKIEAQTAQAEIAASTEIAKYALQQDYETLCTKIAELEARLIADCAALNARMDTLSITATTPEPQITVAPTEPEIQTVNTEPTTPDAPPSASTETPKKKSIGLNFGKKK